MIAAVGEALIDARADGDLPQTHVWGDPYNAAVALGRLGVPTCFGGSVSRDSFGARLVGDLDRARISCTGRLGDAPTPLALRFYLGGTAFDEGPLPGAVPLAADVLVVGLLGLALDPAGAAVEAIAINSAPKRLVVVDPNVRVGFVDTVAYGSRLERLARAGALFKVSREDAAALVPEAKPGHAAADLLDRRPPAVVVTDGPHGATAFTRLGQVDVHAPTVDVVDTIGAGDDSTAELLAWLRQAGRLAPSVASAPQPESWRDALEYAATAGAAQCMRASARGPFAEDVGHVLASEFVKGG